ncbi:MAG: methyltransferase domain-containing protein [Planctomycetaceae bacterium]|jgi:SAM-dependent methyltransferase|nr:methyltransferase domain-containing protein [Planctomycetaceae bacterium]
MKMIFKKIVQLLKYIFNSPTLAHFTVGLVCSPTKSFCPICQNGNRFSFICSGRLRRPNSVCPVCGSFERHRFIWLCFENYWFKNGIDKTEITLLHFAPESCFKQKFHRLFGAGYMTGDITPGRAKKIVDITNIGFPDESYHYIVCNHVLEHIPDDKRALSELYRVLKKGGTAFLSVPIRGETTDEDLSVVDPAERTKRFGQYDHVRYYGLDFKNRIENTGFSVSIFTPGDVIKNEKIRILLGINNTNTMEDNILFIATKK